MLDTDKLIQSQNEGLRKQNAELQRKIRGISDTVNNLIAIIRNTAPDELIVVLMPIIAKLRNDIK